MDDLHNLTSSDWAPSDKESGFVDDFFQLKEDGNYDFLGMNITVSKFERSRTRALGQVKKFVKLNYKNLKDAVPWWNFLKNISFFLNPKEWNNISVDNQPLIDSLLYVFTVVVNNN